MGFENKYPYTDFHELNLDWILETVKQVSTAWPEFESSMETAWQQYKDALTGPTGEWPTFKNDINTSFENFTKQIIHEFDGYTAYNTGDYTYYESKIYKCVSTPLSPFPRQFTDYTWTAVGDNDGLVKDLLTYLRQNINGMQSSITNWIMANAYLYSSANTYTKGDICLNYDLTGLVYFQANQDINVPEEWDSSHWDQVKLADALLTEIRDNYQSMVDAYADFLDTYQRTWGIVQTTGTSINDAMSQNAVTEEIDRLDGKIDGLENGLLDGTVVPNRSLSSDSINPVSEDSGTTQTAPFISQGTGTANNTASVDVSPVAKQLEKQGNTVVVNDWVKELNSTNWVAVSANASYTDGIATLTVTQDNVNSRIQQQTVSGFIKAGHKYWITATVKTPYTQPVAIGLGGRLSPNSYISNSLTANAWNIIFGTIEPNADGATADYIRFNPITATGTYQVNDQVQIKDIHCVDLTQYFNGNDNIPADLLTNPEHWSWYYNGTGSYDTGTLVNASGRYLVCTGRNLVGADDYETGSIDNDTGLPVVDNTNVRLNNYKIIIPNRPFCISRFGTKDARYYWYDKDKNFISSDYTLGIAYRIVTPPSNAVYYKDRSTSSYGGTYKNDHDVSLYYSPEEGGEGYSEHYDYVAPKVYDTGTETLKAFDYKTSDGVVHGRTQDLVLDGTTTGCKVNNVVHHSGTGLWYATVLLTATGVNTTATLKTVVCDKFINKFAVEAGAIYVTANGVTLTLINTDQTLTDITAWNTWLSNNNVTLQYMLATETTEQGTSFPENIEVDDYGMMYWLDTDNNLVSTTQGCKIFYPADYVLYMDTLFTYTNGDPENLAKKTDLVIPDPPNTDGTYTLKVTVTSGTPVYSWIQDI